MPDLELSVSATTREPREGEVDGRDYHFLSREEFDRRVDEKDFLEFATYSGNRYGTLRSRSSAASPPATRWCSRSRSRAPSQVRGGDARVDPDLHRAAGPGGPARAARRAAAPTRAEAIDSRLEVAEQEMAAQDEFAHRVVNDDLGRAADELEGIVRAELGLSLDSARQ